MKIKNLIIDMKAKVSLLALLCLLAFSSEAMALGTIAGTSISNMATATYTLGAGTLTQDSNIEVLTVDELIDMTVTWQDASGVGVRPGDVDSVLTFSLSNTGNGSEKFNLSANSTLGTGDFDPTLTGIFFDTNSNGIYDSGTDNPYIAGTNDPVLSADASVILFLVNSIPSGLTDGDLGNSEISISSATGSGAAGDAFAGLGDSGTNAIIGSSGGALSLTGAYIVSSIALDLVKSYLVSDQFGGSQPVSGATISYIITATVTGVGTATDLVITDPIPSDTTYKDGTLKLDAAVLSKAADGDAGDVGITTAGAVTVTLGNVAAGSAAQTITFDVTIN
ncbi:MAG: hypothetical protein RQ824_03160 [bacterium]|nr:hypothetical protein [bacterium]